MALLAGCCRIACATGVDSLALTLPNDRLASDDNKRISKGARNSIFQPNLANRVARITCHDLDWAKPDDWMDFNSINRLLRCIYCVHATHAMPPLFCALAKFRIELGVQTSTRVVLPALRTRYR